jgi:hypothetical protein
MKPALGQTLVMLAAMIAAYWWLHQPELIPFSLQVFASVILMYFGLKFLRRHKLWYVLPHPGSLELALVTFGTLILIGSTGNLDSPYFFISFIHLFFLVFAAPLTTSLIATLGMMTFHYGLNPVMSQPEFITLLSLPVMLILFTLINQQHQELKAERLLLENEALTIAELEEDEHTLHSFLELFLKPKLALLHQLLQNTDQNRATIQGQLMLIGLEIEKLLQRIKSKSST